MHIKSEVCIEVSINFDAIRGAILEQNLRWINLSIISERQCFYCDILSFFFFFFTFLNFDNLFGYNNTMLASFYPKVIYDKNYWRKLMISKTQIVYLSYFTILYTNKLCYSRVEKDSLRVH